MHHMKVNKDKMMEKKGKIKKMSKIWVLIKRNKNKKSMEIWEISYLK